ncbi:beta-N-acetylhexosaminidase [Deinococcus sp. AJ005]|uniref:beta-N-acetylhexosaminidase n=1 Tax=Deinococcus sp. AJ005 TaxID=2652443 RepID=UPI00125CBE28|nr:beta-N-acetylhexosaminidase [Deinococcus sp. AJ005]QFP75694.1 beta-N-acetylhexosaminidase [Deinococcus sp. AJ005]
MKPARTLIVDLPGPDLTPEQGRFLAQHSFGGVCLFARNITTPARTARLVADIRDALGHDALIATDQEGGAVLRRLDVPHAPTPQALGRLNDVEAAREAGRVAARGLIELGINWNYAPSLDVNVDPLNPVIGERSFGADPRVVAELGVAWAQGSEEMGVLSAVKHFPGHGDTRTDSHLALPVVDKSAAELEAVEWLPFRAAVQANLGSIMTAHILYPQIDAKYPATLSKKLLHGLLRERWGYGGVIVTDAMDMRAVADRYPDGHGAALALGAGADAVLVCGHGDLDIHVRHLEAVQRAVQSSELSSARVGEAVGRLEGAARRFPGRSRPYTAGQQKTDDAWADMIARRSLESLGRLPRLDPQGTVVLIAHQQPGLGGPYGDSLGGEELAQALRATFPGLRLAMHDGQDLSTVTALLSDLPDAAVLLATTERWDVGEAVRQLARTLGGRRVVHVALWNSSAAVELELPALVTYGFRPAQLRALASRLGE